MWEDPNIKYKYTEPVKQMVACPECGHEEGELVNPHADDCSCMTCRVFAALTGKMTISEAMSYTIPKYSNIEKPHATRI